MQKRRNDPACHWLVREAYEDVHILCINICLHEEEHEMVSQDWPEEK